MFGFLSKLLDSNEKEIRRLQKIVESINALEGGTKKIKDSEFPQRIAELRAQISDRDASAAVLPKVYSLVREAASRTLNLRHFDVQMIA